MTILKRLHARLRGFRTLIFAAVVASLGVLNATDLIPLFPPELQKWALAFLPAAFAALRVITKGPVGASPDA